VRTTPGNGLTFGATHAALLYAALAVWATWPLATGLARDVAWDLGDPVLVIWALAWNCTQLLAILGGDVARIGTYFDANIFSPAPHALAYSEHFFAQALQILPVYAITGNAILCYNLLYLSTFVLSGLGAFLFVRELTGSRLAGFTAGLLFALAPYRFPQSSHLQVLSSQWMPLALYGFRRYFETGRRWPLAGAAAALVAQNLSCGYYLLYFSPFAAAYVLAEIAGRERWRDVIAWRDLALAATVVLAVTIPFLLPYLALRSQIQSTRSLAEVQRYSADVYSYLTAFEDQSLWGHVAQAFPKPEGQLFPGVASVLLALAALAPSRRGIPGGATSRTANGAPSAARKRAVAALAALAALHAVLFVLVLLQRRVAIDLGMAVLRASDATQLLLRAAILGVGALALSPGARARSAALLNPRGVCLVALLAACWLSLGPSPTSLGRALDLAAPYRALYMYVPGFDGVRVPARFWMIGTLAISVLGGLGARRLAGGRRLAKARGLPRTGLLVVALVWLLCLAEARVSPFVVNGAGPVAGFNAPEPRLRTGAEVPPVYRAVATQPSDAVLAELPLGQPDFDVRAMYYSTFHWRKLLNGYSGLVPPHYGRLVAALGRVGEQPKEAWAELKASGATLVLVHEGAYLGDEGRRLSAALRDRGARELFRDGTDALLMLP
jgi:hypothetical protein